jgi:hypothetical protein
MIIFLKTEDVNCVYVNISNRSIILQSSQKHDHLNAVTNLLVVENRWNVPYSACSIVLKILNILVWNCQAYKLEDYLF